MVILLVIAIICWFYNAVTGKETQQLTTAQKAYCLQQGGGCCLLFIGLLVAGTAPILYLFF